MVITGLSVDLAAQSGIGFKVENFLTPYYAISAGDVSIEVHVLQHDSQVVLEKGMVDCPEVIPGTINNVTLYAYNDYSKFTKNNRILSRL